MAAKDIDALAALLNLPSGRTDPAGTDRAASVAGRLSPDAQAKLAARSAADESVAGAALALADGTGTIASEIPSATTPADLYATAAAAFEAGEIGKAVGPLCGLLAEPDAQDDAALALAICAVRLERYEQALPLAAESLRHGSRHPRAFCIVGMCELLRGNKAAAQENLALATRMGRNNPDFREDMRLAQRLLLIRHFG